jgi:hypothetical protein
MVLLNRLADTLHLIQIDMNVNGGLAMNRDLFDDDEPMNFGSVAYSRGTDAITSHIAGALVDTNKLESLVYEVVKRYPKGCILDEVISALPHIREHSIQPRFAPLIRKGFLVDTGQKRFGRAGRLQRIVKIKEKNDNDHC